MQQQIRSAHFSRATLYALMANVLQFQKEAQANPSNAGNSKTRAMVCELLAVKLLKDYNTRELIDALSYDFYPLHGLAPQTSSLTSKALLRTGAARTSTLEVAIRASAKKFLAHPAVVQQLEAIWAGTIVFHSAADNLHRKQANMSYAHIAHSMSESTRLLVPGQMRQYGSSPQLSPTKQPSPPNLQARRTVTLYDPRDASLFKLSRLRVPRYRQFFSTCSLAILLVLFVAVLAQRSSDITTLEVIFWLWSAGFMLDEIVGFNEQGFSLYIMSFWNAFDVGILLLLMVYYCMRLYGLLLVDVGRHDWNDMAYDVLAANAILLFPRLFSVLDHYRYFSQLLIAFRLMAIDLVAVSILILIACSGFFVAFTLSFGDGVYDAAGVSYKIFQILMGFTPAAWEAWDTYNGLGKFILALFLVICHFLVVTVLITVLTNSFMSVVSNANDEHQFVFAVNTISMVKNDALFSYLAPSNLFAWALTPLIFLMPFRTFIKVNRMAIKATHFPILFGIYAYEKMMLASTVIEPTDLIQHPQGFKQRLISFQDKSALFSPRVGRAESMAGIHKDTALEELFRLAPRPNALRSTRKKQTNNVVKSWMNHHSGTASPPQDDDRFVVERLERSSRQSIDNGSRAISGSRSVVSDPAEFKSTAFGLGRNSMIPTFTYDQPVDADGDDEHLTHDEVEDDILTVDRQQSVQDDSESDEDFFQTPNTTQATAPRQHTLAEGQPSPSRSSPPRRRALHNRNISTNTIVYNPAESSASPPRRSTPSTAKGRSRPQTGSNTPQLAVNRSLRNSITKETIVEKPRIRPNIPNRNEFQSVPNFKNFSFDQPSRPSPARQNQQTRQVRHRRSSFDMGVSEMGLDHLNPGGGMLSSSFATQMAMANRFGGRVDRDAQRDAERNTEAMMGRLMLARMKTLEEGFAEVVKEFREHSQRTTAANSSVDGSAFGGGKQKGKGKEREKVKGKGKRRESSDVELRRDDSGGYFRDAHVYREDGAVGQSSERPEMGGKHFSKGSSL